MFTNRRIRKHGLPAEATVKSMVPRRYGGAEMSRKYDYVLEVRPGDRAAFEAELTIVAGFLGAKPQEYDILKVKYDPKTLKVLFDYTGDARYETEAMYARTAQMRKETAELLAVKKTYLAGTTSAPEGNAIVAAERRINEFGDHGVLDAMRKVTLKNPTVTTLPGNQEVTGLERHDAMAGLAMLLENGLISGTQYEELQTGSDGT
jgi:hypothetical protein